VKNKHPRYVAKENRQVKLRRLFLFVIWKLSSFVVRRISITFTSAHLIFTEGLKIKNCSPLGWY